MIDYEKLKIAHELILKTPEKYGLACCVGCSFDTYFRLYSLNSEFSEDYDGLEEVIAKLRELTQSEPKYKIDQKVWYINIHNLPVSNPIESIAVEETDKMYLIFDKWFQEDELYATKFDLVEAQTKHWQSLTNNIDMSLNKEENPELNLAALTNKQIYDKGYLDGIGTCIKPWDGYK
jgi:hypothetical protein